MPNKTEHISLLVTKDIHSKLLTLAIKDDRSVNSFITKIIKEYIDKHKK